MEMVVPGKGTSPRHGMFPAFPSNKDEPQGWVMMQGQEGMERVHRSRLEEVIERVGEPKAKRSGLSAGEPAITITVGAKKMWRWAVGCRWPARCQYLHLNTPGQKAPQG